MSRDSQRDDRERNVRDGDRERQIQCLLRDRAEPITVGELAETLHESASEGADDFEARGDVHEHLVDRVLPALDEAGTVTFDEERGVVSPAEATGDGDAAVDPGAPTPLQAVTAVRVALLAVVAVVAAVTVVGIRPATLAGAGGTTLLVGIWFLGWFGGTYGSNDD